MDYVIYDSGNTSFTPDSTVTISSMQTDKVTIVKLSFLGKTYKGEAIRHPDDKPDDAVGYALALSRAFGAASKQYERSAWRRPTRQRP